jgi:hypothetical protein
MEFSQEFMTKFNIVKVNKEVFEWHDKHKINPKPKENKLLKEIYTFSDLLADETKEEYFKRSGLCDNLEYLVFLFKKFVDLESCKELKNIIPSEIGGSVDWLIEVDYLGSYDGGREEKETGSITKILSIEEDEGKKAKELILYIVNTNLTKKEYFEKFPNDFGTMKYLLSEGICSHVLGRSGTLSFTRDLVPPEYANLVQNSTNLDKWLDITKSNDELRRIYQENGGEGKKKQKVG